jgi:diguanylate cyclase (GGDEF)-like protein/PAS domain S-box-containing protein
MKSSDKPLSGRFMGYTAEQQTILHRLSQCWTSGNFATIPDLLARFDMTPPTFAWNPLPAGLPDSRFGEMYRIWKEQAGDNTLPRQQDCNPEVFRQVPDLEGCLMILDYLPGKEFMFYRYYGKELAGHSGTNWQGRTTADMARFSTHALIFASSYLAVAARGEPLYNETISSPKLVATTWCRYILPYVNARGRIVSFACANIPVPGLPSWNLSSLSPADPPGQPSQPDLVVTSGKPVQLGQPDQLVQPGQAGQSVEPAANAGSTNLEALLGMERNIRDLLAHAPSALMILAAGSHQIYFLNKALAEMLGYEELELVGKDPRQLFAEPDDYRRAKLGAASARGTRDREVLLRGKDGSGVWTLMSTHVIIFDHNRTTAFWFWDHSRRKAEEEALRAAERHQAETIQRLEAVQKQLWSLANTDTLTGIPNRRHLDNLLDYEFRRIKRSETTLALLMVDIDLFKQVNDRYGHPVGDEVLRHVARLLDARKRDTDTLARYGGEEFVLLLTDTAGAGAFALAEALRLAIANEPAWVHGQSIAVTISIGVACTGGDIKTREDLLAGADHAMYQAKAKGRNRVELGLL